MYLYFAQIKQYKNLTSFLVLLLFLPTLLEDAMSSSSSSSTTLLAILWRCWMEAYLLQCHAAVSGVDSRSIVQSKSKSNILVKFLVCRILASSGFIC